MSVTWHNVCICGDPCADRDTALAAQMDVELYSDFDDPQCKWLRVEERWNGYPLRPCVGMRADQASHQLIRKFYISNNIPFALGPWELEPRHD